MSSLEGSGECHSGLNDYGTMNDLLLTRTDWSGRSMAFAEKRHPAYDHLDAKKRAEGRHMNQVGDPVKGAKAMYDLAVMKDPPLRVVIGSDAYQVYSLKRSKKNSQPKATGLICSRVS